MITPVNQPPSYLYDRSIPQSEWRWYVESLAEKCIIGLREDANEVSQLYFRDDLLKGVLAAEKSDVRFARAYLEYIRFRCRMAGVDFQLARRYLNLVREFSVQECLDVVFDDARRGWPFGFMGYGKAVLQSSGQGWRGLRQCWPELVDIFEVARNQSAYKADVFEVEGFLQGVISEEERFEKYVLGALEFRKKIYAENALMLGRSYLHVAEYANGVRRYDEIVGYLDEAVKLLPKEGDDKFFLAQAHDYWAMIADQKIDEREDEDKYREIVAEHMEIAYNTCPELYQTREGFDEDTFVENMRDGYYCY